MEENKKITTRQITDDEILEAIIKLCKEDREALLMLDFDIMRIFANEPEKAIECQKYWAYMSMGLQNFCKATSEFLSALNK